MRLFKNKKILIILAVIIFGGILLVIITQMQGGESGEPGTTIVRPTPNANYTITFKGLKAGESTMDDVQDKLGRSIGNDGDTYYYNSGYENDPNVVVYKDGIAQYIKEVVSLKENRQVAEAENLYGQPEQVLYSRNLSGGAALFSYPNQGYAFVGNPNTGTIYESWFFVPTSDEDFMSTWAEGYTTTEEFGYY